MVDQSTKILQKKVEGEAIENPGIAHSNSINASEAASMEGPIDGDERIEALLTSIGL
jgi:hypothetical protein